VIVLSYFAIDLIKIFLAKQLQTKLTPHVIFKIKKIMGILLIIFGLFIIAKGVFPKRVANFDKVIEKIK